MHPFITRSALLLIGLVLVRVIYNLYYWILANHFYKRYIEFIKEPKSWFIRENKQRIIKLFKQAGIEDSLQPRVKLAGYGMVHSTRFSVFENLSVRDPEIAPIINGNFREAIGIYKQRILESFNPLFWIESLIHLPKIFLNYLGISSGSFFIKLAQLVWWIIGAISVIVGLIFNSEFISWLSSKGFFY